jgi:hypothetical protein
MSQSSPMHLPAAVSAAQPPPSPLLQATSAPPWPLIHHASQPQSPLASHSNTAAFTRLSAPHHTAGSQHIVLATLPFVNTVPTSRQKAHPCIFQQLFPQRCRLFLPCLQPQPHPRPLIHHASQPQFGRFASPSHPAPTIQLIVPRRTHTASIMY